ncbi:MAG: amino acid permease [Bacteroidales bacterium]
MGLLGKNKLNKELGLVDVFALSTGSMFSSGFFLLPGLAAFYAGPAVFLSYLIAAFLILPAMFSIAELATAIPRAGGVYFLLDRSLGPMMGAIGGIGTYLSLVLKTAFALVGIGAYTGIFFDAPIRLIAIGLTAFFMILNIVGAKKTTGLQRFLVFFLISVLVLFMVEGVRELFSHSALKLFHQQYTPFAPHGLAGIISTAGFVFVAYLGLTKIASVAEEIKNPERNIPLGMLLSLIVTTVIYVVGVFIMVGAIPADDFFKDLTPVWTASQNIFKWIPPKWGGLLVVGAAIAAFASTGNGGLMAASRYPLAMGRDKVVPSFLTHLSRFKTPIYSILLTSGLMVLFIVSFSAEGIAKMASAFQLIIFILINFAVIVMRSSKIESYDPGYHSPFYPWMQIFGMISSFLLVIYMGWGPALFSMGIIALSMLWYWYYARKNVKREGAIYHWFALLGQKQHVGLENELLHILKEKGLREGDPFDEMIVEAQITKLKGWRMSFNKLVEIVTNDFSKKINLANPKELKKEILKVTSIDPALVIPRVSILHGKVPDLNKPLLNIVVANKGVKKPIVKGEITSEDDIQVFFFMVSSTHNPKLQLRMLSRLMDIVERPSFIDEVLSAENERELKEYLLHNDRYITLELIPDTSTEHLIDKMLKDIRFPQDVLVAMIQRKERILTPRGDTELKSGDIITIIGEPKGIQLLFNKYIHMER